MTQPKSMRQRAAHRACALLLALTSTGCSLKFVRPPPPRSDWPDPVTSDSSQQRCTDVIALPIADTLATTGLGTIGYLERNSGSRSIALVFDAGAIAFLVSAVYGYVDTERCHRYDRLFDEPQQLATAPASAPAPPPHTR